MADFIKVISELRKSGISDLHIYPGESIFTRNSGTLARMKDIIFSEDEVKKIILTTSTQKAREILGKAKQVNYAWEDPAADRYRISTFFERGKFALSIRFVQSAPPKFADLGFPEVAKKIFSKTSGLIIVGSPSGHGKTTTIAAILDFINQHFEKNIITVENPVEIKFKDQRSSFIQRSIPLDVSNFFEGLSEAYKLDPDVVVSDSIGYKDVMDQAIFLCEAGCLVIGGTDGGDCQSIIERIIYARPKEEREIIKNKLISHLSLVICQRLVPRVDIGRVAAFEMLVNNQQVKTVLKGDNLSLLKNVIETDMASGMQTYDKCLKGLVTKLLITPATAAAFFPEGTESAAKFAKK